MTFLLREMEAIVARPPEEFIPKGVGNKLMETLSKSANTTVISDIKRVQIESAKGQKKIAALTILDKIRAIVEPATYNDIAQELNKKLAKD